MNRLLIIFVAVTFATFPVAAQQGQLINDAMFSFSLERPIWLNVYLPPDYSESGPPYPLLIDLHGGGGSN